MSSFPQEDVALERLCCFQTYNILITLLGARGIVLLYKKDDLYAKVVILLHLMVLHQGISAAIDCTIIKITTVAIKKAIIKSTIIETESTLIQSGYFTFKPVKQQWWERLDWTGNRPFCAYYRWGRPQVSIISFQMGMGSYLIGMLWKAEEWKR